MEERKGLLTEEQEKILDDLIELKGISESLDGLGIRLVDNMAVEKIKAKIPEQYLPVVYEIIDELFKALQALTKE